MTAIVQHIAVNSKAGRHVADDVRLARLTMSFVSSARRRPSLQ